MSGRIAAKGFLKIKNNLILLIRDMKKGFHEGIYLPRHWSFEFPDKIRFSHRSLIKIENTKL